MVIINKIHYIVKTFWTISCYKQTHVNKNNRNQLDLVIQVAIMEIVKGHIYVNDDFKKYEHKHDHMMMIIF